MLTTMQSQTQSQTQRQLNENLLRASMQNSIDGIVEFHNQGAQINCCDESDKSSMHLVSANGNSEAIKVLASLGAEIDNVDCDGRTPLILASKNGHLEAVKALYKLGAKIDIADDNGFTALMYSSRNGHFAVVELLVNSGADVDKEKIFYNFYRKNALIFACANGHLEIIEFLVKSGADPNKALREAGGCKEVKVIETLHRLGANIYKIDDYNGNTALSEAARNNNFATIKYLVERDADINRFDCDGNTALFYAVRYKNIELIEFLLKSGANANLTSSNFTPLMLACENGQLEAIKLLLKSKETDVNMTNDKGFTALMFAVYSLNVAVVKFLVESGAEIDKADNGGETALTMACNMIRYKEGSPEIIEFLVKSGADANKALMYAAQKGYNADIKIIKILHQAGVEIDQPDDKGWTALMFAVKNCRDDLTDLLVELGANINKVSNDGFSPYKYARSNSHIDFFGKLIISKTFDMADDYERRAYFFHVASEGQFGVIKSLIKAQVDVNITNGEDSTPFHIVCTKGHADAIKVLIEAEVDVNKVNSGNKTAGDLANENKHGELLIKLLDEDKERIISKIKDELGISLIPTGKASDQKEIIELEEKIKELTTSPESYNCPLSHKIMIDPVVTSHGNTYEKRAIVDWLKTSNRDPISNLYLGAHILTPNNILKQIMAPYIEINTQECFKALIKSIELGQEEFAKKLIDRIKETNNGKFFSCSVIKKEIDQIKTSFIEPGGSISLASGIKVESQRRQTLPR